ncbi:methyltransferase-like protein 22 isoform 1-T2 [Discoglossus pictus]
MEEITFTKDTVLSDIHLHSPRKRHLMVRLNAVGQPVFLSQFKILWHNNQLDTGDSESENVGDESKTTAVTEHCGEDAPAPHENDSQGIENLLDDDGDLEVLRRPHYQCEKEEEQRSRDVVCPTILTIGNGDYFDDDDDDDYSSWDVVRIEHTMATPLEDVGKQVWRGAFLLADYVLWQRDQFRGCTVLELGAGTGFTSIMAATVAKTLYCTDVGDDLLEMCEKNVSLNRSLIEHTGGEVKVKEIDWLKNSLCTDPDIPYSWSEEEIADLYDNTTIIIAADVFYDDELTDALFKTLYRISHAMRNSCTIYLSIERRLNFTLRHMDITCEAYNHFRGCLSKFETTRDKVRWRVEQIRANVPQSFSYERIEQLELWRIVADPPT